MNKIKNIIFDFDGTLVDTQVDIMTSFKKAIYKIKGINIDTSSFTVGPPLEEMVQVFFPDISNEDLDQVVVLFRKIYSNCEFQQTFCYQGINELLKSLKSKSLSIYIATNKPYYLTKRIIEKLNVDLFDAIYTVDMIAGEKLSKKKMISLLIEDYHMEAGTVIMIGDSASDIDASYLNGIRSIGVGYGYDSKENILNAYPTYYCETVKELKEIILKI